MSDRRLNWAAVAAIPRRDLTVVARSRAVSLPILILPVIFFVLLPAGAVAMSGVMREDLAEFQELLSLIPGPLLADLQGLDPAATMIVWALEYMFASFFLIIPLMVSAVIAADSFAGEKERKTMEALIYTPTSDLELYAGKVLGPWIAAVAIGIGGYLVYAVVANVLGAGIVGRPIVVTPRWLLVAFVLGPAVSALAIGVLVQVSARVRGFQEAYQLGGLVVLPVVILFVSQVSGALYLDIAVLVVLSAVVWVLAVVALGLGFRSFRRERLLLAA